MQKRKPEWVKFKIPGGSEYVRVKRIINERGLHTVCLEAGCPNIGECFNNGTATFLILGNICTRNCRYCAVEKGNPEFTDYDEPVKVAEAIEHLGLNYAVITSVTRDDLEDGGAEIFVSMVRNIRERIPECKIELLVPDFGESMEESIKKIVLSGPDIINHNIEVVKNYYEGLRPLGNYALSLKLLDKVAASGIPAKSGLMIGFGETMDDIETTLKDLQSAGCSILTVGQYLQSKKTGFPVEKYYTPEEFEEIKKMARDMGFKKILSGPLVRSSYHAGELCM